MKHKSYVYKKFESENVLSYFRATVLDFVTFHTNKIRIRIILKGNFSYTRYTQSFLTIYITIYMVSYPWFAFTLALKGQKVHAIFNVSFKN